MNHFIGENVAKVFWPGLCEKVKICERSIIL